MKQEISSVKQEAKSTSGRLAPKRRTKATARSVTSSPVVDAAQSAKPLRIQALGAFRVFVGDSEIPPSAWKSRKAQLVLKYLLVRGPGLSVAKEALMELLWPEGDPVLSSQSLRAAITALRRTLEPDLPARKPSSYLASGSGRCALTLGEGGCFDVAEFDRKIALANELEAGGDKVSAATEYRAALALYSGEFLEDEPYAEWAFPARDRLAESYGLALVRLGTFCLSQGNLADACRLALRAVESDRAWEPAYHLILAAYARSGQWRRATVMYDRYKSALEEYDLPPPPRLEALLNEVRLAP